MRTALINQRAGTMPEMYCSISGILSMGNIRPERITVGIISPMPETSTAAICDCTMFEMNKPSESDSRM